MPRILSFDTSEELVGNDVYTKVTVNIQSTRYSSFSFLTGDWNSETYFTHQNNISFETIEGFKVVMTFHPVNQGNPVENIDIKFFDAAGNTLLTLFTIKCSRQLFEPFVYHFVEEEIIEVSSSDDEEIRTP